MENTSDKGIGDPNENVSYTTTSLCKGEDGNFKCPGCWYSYKSSIILNIHISSEHPHLFHAPKVNYGGWGSQSQTLERRLRRGRNNWKSEQLSVLDMVLHYTTPQLEKENGRYKCLACDYSATISSAVNKHIKDNHPRFVHIKSKAGRRPSKDSHVGDAFDSDKGIGKVKKTARETDHERDSDQEAKTRYDSSPSMDNSLWNSQSKPMSQLTDLDGEGIRIELDKDNENCDFGFVDLQKQRSADVNDVNQSSGISLGRSEERVQITPIHEGNTNCLILRMSQHPKEKNIGLPISIKEEERELINDSSTTNNQRVSELSKQLDDEKNKVKNFENVIAAKENEIKNLKSKIVEMSSERERDGKEFKLREEELIKKNSEIEREKANELESSKEREEALAKKLSDAESRLQRSRKLMELRHEADRLQHETDRLQHEEAKIQATMEATKRAKELALREMEEIQADFG